MFVLILIAILLYLSLWGSGLFYLIKMKRINDGDQKLRFTYNCLGAVALEQILSLAAIIMFYAVRLDDAEINVPNIAAVLSAVIMAIGFVATGYFFLFIEGSISPSILKKERLRKRRLRLII